MSPTSPCPVCSGVQGRIVHRTRERIYDLPGEWDLRECDACGTLTLVDPPVGAALGAYYPKRASEETARGTPAEDPGAGQARFDRAHYRAKFDPTARGLAPALLRLLPLRGWRRGIVLRPGAQHLDVGCHNGDFLALTRSFGLVVTGVELDPHAASIARSRGIDVREGTLADAKFPDAQFDVITLNHVFEHLPDPGAHLAELHRILKPGGTLILATPNPRSLQHAVFGDDWVHLDSPRHLHMYSPAALARFGERHGLRRVRTRYLSSWGYLLRSIRYRRNTRRSPEKGYFEPLGVWGGRWAERFGALLLGVVDLARWGDEAEVWLTREK